VENKMPQDPITFLQRLQEDGFLNYFWILILSFWAGTARYLTSLNGEKPSFIGWVTETCVSGFVGVIAALTCQYFKMDFLIIAAITGICAHNGTRTLYLIGKILKKQNPIINQLILDEEEDTQKKTQPITLRRKNKHDE
jgi:hypothetical protein